LTSPTKNSNATAPTAASTIEPIIPQAAIANILAGSHLRHPTDNANQNVTQETKAPTFHHHSGQPT